VRSLDLRGKVMVAALAAGVALAGVAVPAGRPAYALELAQGGTGSTRPLTEQAAPPGGQPPSRAPANSGLIRNLPTSTPPPVNLGTGSGGQSNQTSGQGNSGGQDNQTSACHSEWVPAASPAAGAAARWTSRAGGTPRALSALASSLSDPAWSTTHRPFAPSAAGLACGSRGRGGGSARGGRRGAWSAGRARCSGRWLPRW
jgi:hypothetical protein